MLLILGAVQSFQILRLEETGQRMESRYEEISSVGQEQAETMRLSEQSGLWILDK